MTQVYFKKWETSQILHNSGYPERWFGLESSNSHTCCALNQHFSKTNANILIHVIFPSQIFLLHRKTQRFVLFSCRKWAGIVPRMPKRIPTGSRSPGNLRFLRSVFASWRVSYFSKLLNLRSDGHHPLTVNPSPAKVPCRTHPTGRGGEFCLPPSYLPN